MIEMNLSCPQMTSHAMGSDVGTNPELCREYCAAVKKGTKLPVLAKMTPNITDMVPVAKACMEGGADGIAAINTVKSITDLDLDRAVGLPVINGKSSVSGYSGKAVKPIALRFVQQLRAGIPGLPVSGIGGIETWEDALEFILLGASTLQVTTAVMQYGYRIVEDMKNGLMHYLEDHGVEHLSDLVGLANKNIIPAEDLDRDYIVHPALKAEACIGCGRCYISCSDGAHQAIRWNETERRPDFDTEKCVGCLLCSLVCPTGAITKGEVIMKPNRSTAWSPGNRPALHDLDVFRQSHRPAGLGRFCRLHRVLRRAEERPARPSCAPCLRCQRHAVRLLLPVSREILPG